MMFLGTQKKARIIMYYAYLLEKRRISKEIIGEREIVKTIYDAKLFWIMTMFH
jgi:hypothetical protein